MDAGQTFTTTLAGGSDGEMIYWGQAEDGGWLVTWATRHSQYFTPEEGPKDSGEPFVIYSRGELAVRDAYRPSHIPPHPDAGKPYATPLTEGEWWVTKTDTRTGQVTGLEVDRYVARDEAYNGVPVMTAAHSRRVMELARWREREGRREPAGPGQPQIGAQVKSTLPDMALDRIDAMIEQGRYRTRSQAVRQIVMDSLASDPDSE